MKRLIPLVALLAGCSGLSLQWPWGPAAPPAPPDSPAPPADSGTPPGSAGPPPPESRAATIESYKTRVAQAILDGNTAHTFSGSLPKILKSIVVLQISVDQHGLASEVKLLRSNGFRELEARAIQSVRSATLPKPDGVLMANSGHVQFTETWLFGNDGRFQIRTLAGAQ